MASLDPARGSAVARALFAVRWKLGALFGWDDPGGGLDARVPTLRDRLPAELRETAASAPPSALPFVPLYVTANEGALEIANRTMHGVLHLGWVADGTGGHRGQMAILVKRNGLLGSAYMAAIAPFRHVLVYPAMLREIERRWHFTLNG